MKNNKLHISLWLIVAILLSITIIVFSDTLALFETDAEGDVTSDVGKWVITVNNETITNAETDTINIDSFVYTANSHVESGYIAPGGTAYVDLTVDASGCDVAVLYDIDLNLSNTSYGENISFSLEDSAHTVTRTDEYVYTGIIHLNELATTRTVRIYVTWNDLAVFNDSDTELGSVEDSLLTIPIKFRAKQYLGETITEYVPQDEIYRIALDNQGAGTTGTTELYYKYTSGSGNCTYYINSAATQITTSIQRPTKTNFVFDGYYTEQNGGGTQIIDGFTPTGVNSANNGGSIISGSNLCHQKPRWLSASNTDTITLYAGWGKLTRNATASPYRGIEVADSTKCSWIYNGTSTCSVYLYVYVVRGANNKVRGYVKYRAEKISGNGTSACFYGGPFYVGNKAMAHASNNCSSNATNGPYVAMPSDFKSITGTESNPFTSGYVLTYSFNKSGSGALSSFNGSVLLN